MRVIQGKNQTQERLPGFKRIYGAPNGIRTRADGLKGRCPRPLDDGDTTLKLYQSYLRRTNSYRIDFPMGSQRLDNIPSVFNRPKNQMRLLCLNRRNTGRRWDFDSPDEKGSQQEIEKAGSQHQIITKVRRKVVKEIDCRADQAGQGCPTG